MSEFDNLGIIINNTVITIIIIILILCFLPTISLFINHYIIGINDKLIDKFINSEIKIDMEHNMWENLYLFSSYIPYKRIKRCDKYGIGDPDKKDHDLHLTHANNIIKQFDKIKRECDGPFYNTIKKDSDKKIQENKSEREKKEHEEYLIQIKEWGENDRVNKALNQKWVLYLFGGANNIIKYFFKFGLIIIKIIGFVKPIINNKVIMGFIILLLVIFAILYAVKLRNIDYNTSISYGKTSSDKNSESNSWFSWINGSSIWYEITDTYKYYDNMMNTFSIYELTGGLIGAENKIEGGKIGDTILDREITDGKIYDNLSYIMLSELELDTNQIDKLKSFLPINNIETGKYYNIYLPEEKFKADASIVKWKVYNKIDDKGKITNEKKWGINCEEIDKIKNKDGTVTDNPAFITVLNGNGANDKCVINENGFKKVNNVNLNVDSDELIYDTEKIK
jgi:hypothetical protein